MENIALYVTLLASLIIVAQSLAKLGRCTVQTNLAIRTTVWLIACSSFYIVLSSAHFGVTPYDAFIAVLIAVALFLVTDRRGKPNK